MKKNVIFTSSDAKYGNFLINHWLRSLKMNVNLKNTDVVILDYGLTESQVNKLVKQDVIVYKCKRDGHVTSLRFRDMGNYLNEKNYAQILSSDGGDIIFQSDINYAFNMHKTEMRAACEDLTLMTTELSMFGFRVKDYIRILRLLADKKQINAGILFGPCDKFKKLCFEVTQLIKDKKNFGPDQVAVNYLLYRDGFFKLNQKYNFILYTTKERYNIKKGIFYNKRNEVIPIVHNYGQFSFLRYIKNFGYGKGFNNKFRKRRYLLIKSFFLLSDKIQKSKINFQNIQFLNSRLK